MARRTTITYYSDLSGRPISAEGVSVPFSLDGIDYEIDLTAGELDELRDALAPFLRSARTAPRDSRAGVGTPASSAAQPSAKDLREWAMENGFDVPARGRVPELVREAYRAAHTARENETIRRLLLPTRD